MSGLSATDVRLKADGLDLVRGVSIRVEPGTPFTILGETGSGKSLLAQTIMGTLPREIAAQGSISIAGKEFDAADIRARRPLWGREIAMLPQEPWLSLDPTMRIEGQVEEGFHHVAGIKKGAFSAALRLLARLGLSGAERKFPFALSGGMAQRAAFAATRAGGASILIVDEPTKGLDATLRDALVAMLLQARDEGATLLTITHDLAVARALGGRIAVMLNGEIIEEGPAEAVLTAPQHDYTKRLIAAEPSAWPRFPAAHRGEKIASATALSKGFGGRTLFSGLDLSLHAGERLVVTGPSGSGKSTLGNLLIGTIKPDSGSIQREGGAALFRFQKIYQDPPAAFAPRLTLRRALVDLVNLHALDWSEVERLMLRLGLASHLLDRLPGQVSGGELQRFALLRTLLLKPALLVADEPTSRLDPITQHETINLLVEVCTRDAIALLLVTHDPDIASKVATRGDNGAPLEVAF